MIRPAHIEPITRRLWLVVALVIGLAPSAHAQQAKRRVTFTFSTGVFDHELPQQKRFYIDVKLPRDYRLPPAQAPGSDRDDHRPRLWRVGDDEACGAPPAGTTALLYADPRGALDATTGERTVSLEVPRLESSARYCFQIFALGSLSDAEKDRIKAAARAAITGVLSYQGKSPADAIKAAERAVAVALGPELASKRAGAGDKETARTVKSVVLKVLDLDGASGSAPDGPSFVQALSVASQVRSSCRNLPTYYGKLAAQQFSTKDAFPDGPPGHVKTFLAAHRDVIQRGFDARLFVAGAIDDTCVDRQGYALTAEIEALAGAASALVASVSAVHNSGVCQAARRPPPVKRKRKRRRSQPDPTRQAVVALCDRIDDAGGHARSLAREIVRIEQQVTELKQDVAELAARASAEVGALKIEQLLQRRPQALDFKSRAQFYVSIDVGGVIPIYQTDDADLALFTGVNIYLSAVDKDIPLALEGGFFKRFSLTAGFTLDAPTDSADTVDGLIGGRAGLLGAGYRITDYVRLGAGVFLFRQKHPNPTVTDKRFRISPYLSASIDIDLVGIIKGGLSKAAEL